jgi:hypothetical protein
VGEEVHTVWVINDAAAVDGTVREQLVVMNGSARVAGRVLGNVVSLSGAVELAPSARVDGDVVLYNSTIARAPGAVVLGRVVTEPGYSFGERILAFFWASMTVVVLLGGLLFAAIAGEQLYRAAFLIGEHPRETTLAALVVAIGLPLAAVAAFLSVVGIPLGFALLCVLLPVLAFLGYLVSGAALGSLLLRRGWGEVRDRPYLAILVGLLLLQLTGFVPWIGGVVVLAASLAGTGALALRVWRQWRHPQPRDAVMVGAATAPAA